MGLTSTTGTESFNRSLSQRRAASVVTFLRQELSKDFSVNLELDPGKSIARIAGLGDNTEDMNWRAVIVGVWAKPAPPPRPSPPPMQEECKRTVISSSGGVGYYAFYNGRGGGVIEQGPKVKASPDFMKCSTDFERRWSFLAHKDSFPVVLEYTPRDYIDHVVGEVIGHYMTVSRFRILADTSALSRLPPPYRGSVLNLPIDALLNGYAATGPNKDGFIQLGVKVPLYVGVGAGNGLVSIAYSDEGAESYTVVTDVYGKILLVVSKQGSRYPKSETTLHVIVKSALKGNQDDD